MFAVVEGGMSYYTITVDGDKVTSEEFIPDATYVDEFYACEESEDNEIVFIYFNKFNTKQKKRSTWCSSSFVVQKEPCPYYWTRLLL